MPNTRAVRFSIVIPCYNEEKYIAKTLKSINQQDFTGDFEVIVVDNNSTDNTATIAKKYGAKIVKESRPGVCWARQAGTEASNGEIIISTDADTTFDKNWLANIDSRFIKNPNAVAACAPCRFVDAPWWGEYYPHLLFGAVYTLYRLTGFTFYITATNTAFKKNTWTKYNTELPQGGDELDLLRKLRKKGKVIFSNNYFVYTSSRRLDHGLWYNLFVTFGYYYLLAYYVNRIFKREIIGSAPAYRENVLFKIPKNIKSSAKIISDRANEYRQSTAKKSR
jgi:glycosyltransferase involved in cell wall biosynthesis